MQSDDDSVLQHSVPYIVGYTVMQIKAEYGFCSGSRTVITVCLPVRELLRFLQFLPVKCRNFKPKMSISGFDYVGKPL